MRNFHPLSLRFRLLALLAFTVLPFLAMVSLDTRARYQRTERTLEENMLRLREYVRDEVDHRLEANIQLLGATLALYRDTPAERRSARLQELAALNPRVLNVGIASTSGTVLASALPETVRPLLDDKAHWLREAAEGSLPARHLSVDYLEAENKLGLAYTGDRPGDGEAPRVAVAVVDIDWLHDLVQEARVAGRISLLPPGIVLTVVHRSGTIIARYPDNERWEGRAIGDSALFEAASSQTVATPVEVVGVDGVARRYAFAAVSAAPRDIQVIVGGSMAEALAPARRDFYRNLLLVGAIAVLAGAAAWIGNEIIVARPVQVLLDATKRIGGGDLRTRVGTARGPRELRELAAALDTMSDVLQRNEEERGRARAKLAQHERKLRSLAVELTLAEERERKQVAAALHDNVGPLLATCYMKLGRAQRATDAEHRDRLLCDARELVDQAVRHAQTLTHDISSPLLYSLGLSAALDQLCRDVERDHGLHVAFRGDIEADALSNDQRIVLYRAARELLHNVVKHARATAAEVVCACRNGEVSVQVRDDGAGFEAEGGMQGMTRMGGYGLFNLRERFTHLGGRFVLQTATARGTSVLVALPLCPIEKTQEELA